MTTTTKPRRAMSEAAGITPKLKLQADPTFVAEVLIPVPGDEPASVFFTFQHKTKDDLKEFLAKADKRKPEEVILEIASDWNLTDAKFSKESVRTLTQHHHAAAPAILKAYLDELLGQKTGAA